MVRVPRNLFSPRAFSDSFGPRAISIFNVLPSLTKLLVDPNETVREACCCALVEAYRHVGTRLRIELSKNKSMWSKGMVQSWFTLLINTYSRCPQPFQPPG